MIKHLTTLLLVIGLNAFSQTNKIQFNYDTAGNQITRQLCLSCLSRTNQNIKNFEQVTTDDFQKFSPEDNFSYYPNPVKEELYLKWEIKDVLISSIELYNLNGSLLKSLTELNGVSTQSINFSGYPVGTYVLHILDSSGNTKTIKVIKQ
ncbi:MAG: T9SS type A sorting domain-containing protein [Flavobacteriales bacterium]|nr:T9SS type A sorting domain-containing protein [Flavobacteriales bacterium]